MKKYFFIAVALFISTASFTQITVNNILVTCNAANTFYTVSFEVSGGTAPYTVTENAPGGIGGAFTGNIWLSNLIPSGTPYDFDVDDAGISTPINIAGNKICNCLSNAGTMDLTLPPLELCETATATATANGNHYLDPNDYIMYVLHTNNTDVLGTVLDTNVVAPIFNFSTPLLAYGTTYYISTVVGDSLGNFVDHNDGCLQVAPGKPVTWHQSNDAGANDSTTTFCNSSLTLFDLNTLLTVPTGGTWAETTGSTQFTAATGMFDPSGLASNTYAFTYTVSGGSCPDDVSNFGVTVTAQGNAGADDLTAELCDLPGMTLDLNTLLSGSSGTGEWLETTAVLSNQFDSISGVFDPDGLTAGAYTFIYHMSGTSPCLDDTASFTVTVSDCNPPVASFTASTMHVCIGDDVTFTDNSTGLNITAWDWDFDFSIVGGVTPSNALVQGPHVVSYSTPGTYSVRLSITDSAGTDDTVITITVGNCVIADFLTSNDTICAGDSIIFTDASTSTMPITNWFWSFDINNIGGVTPPVGINQGPDTVFFASPGTYDVQLIAFDGGGIVDTIVKSVTVLDCRPVSNFTVSNDTICRNGSVTFTDVSTGSPTSYQWTFPGGTPASSTSANPGAIIYDTEGVYTATLVVTNSYGTSIDNSPTTINVINCDPAVAGIIMNDDDGNICIEGCIQFSLDDTLGGVPDSLIWTFEGVGFAMQTVVSTDPNEVIDVCWTNDSIGSFIVSLSVKNRYNNGVFDVFTDTIEVHEQTTIFAGDDVDVDFGFDTQIRGEVRDSLGNILSPNGGTISWSPETFLSTPDLLGSEVIQPTDTTVYTITYEDVNGCISMDQVSVNVNYIFNIGVPSAFTPLGSSNNILYVKGKLGIESISFVVYNRYGQKVFETTDVNQGWDGTHKGKGLNPGVFVYYVKATFLNGSIGEIKGNVTLIK